MEMSEPFVHPILWLFLLFSAMLLLEEIIVHWVLTPRQSHLLLSQILHISSRNTDFTKVFHSHRSPGTPERTLQKKNLSTLLSKNLRKCLQFPTFPKVLRNAYQVKLSFHASSLIPPCPVHNLLRSINAQFSLDIFEQYLERNGLPRGSISRTKLNQLLIRIEKASDFDSLDSIGRSEFSLSITSNISIATTLWDILGTVSGVVYWFTVFEKQLAIEGPLAAEEDLKSRLMKKFQQSVIRHKGDLKQAHRSYKKALIAEARKVLSPREVQEQMKRIRLLEEQEKKNLEMVYGITGSTSKKRRSGIA